MDRPTKKQERELWEWCGFRKFGWVNWDFYCPPDEDLPDGIPVGAGITHDFAKQYKLPEIDLNNLFKYAVPKLEKEYKLWNVQFDAPWGSRASWIITIECQGDKPPREWSDGGEYYCGRSPDPALALFWAIWEVIKVDNNGE